MRDGVSHSMKVKWIELSPAVATLIECALLAEVERLRADMDALGPRAQDDPEYIEHGRWMQTAANAHAVVAASFAVGVLVRTE